MRPQVYDIAADKWEWGPTLSRVSKYPAALLVLRNQLTFIDIDRFPCLHIERLAFHSDVWKSSEVTVDFDGDGDLPKEAFHFYGSLKM